MDLPPSLPPAPPPARSRWRLAIVLVVLGATIGLVGAFVQIPYYTLGPGPALDVSQLVRVSDERVYTSSGSFFLTTVSVSPGQLSLFEAFKGWLDPAEAVVPKSRVIIPGFTDQEQDEFNALDMERSKYAATIAAVRAVGIEAPLIPGARVIAVVPNAPADGKLKPDDLIVAVDGASVRDAVSAVRIIQRHKIGSQVTIDVLRGAQKVHLSMSTISSPLSQNKDVPVIGAALEPAFRLPFGVTVDSRNIGGPSAGLAFALEISDILTPEDLTRGHRIAVTGTIDISGVVGPVGGVSFKIRAAEREGADVFLVPKDELEEATAAASKVRVIGVSTLAEALAAVRTLDYRAPAA